MSSNEDRQSVANQDQVQDIRHGTLIDSRSTIPESIPEYRSSKVYPSTHGSHGTGGTGDESDIGFAPSRGVSLSWRDLTVSIKSGSRKAVTEKTILHNVSGTAPCGSLLAIIGASGAGKSTLLNVLTTRNTGKYTIKGDIYMNGVKSFREDIQNMSAYVQQGDLFINTLTVREHLRFRALLRMDKRMNKAARLSRVEQVIIEMGLSKCADTRIGLAHGGGQNGISGGERKRLCFAAEALTDPPIFFCDEPTSSLDSFMAQKLILCLQKMAEKKKTILCTIHQPSSDVFSLFTHLLIMADGKVAFTGKSADAMAFFSSLGHPCPYNFNPADHYILTMAIEPGNEQQCREKIQRICDAYKSSEFSEEVLSHITESVSKSNLPGSIEAIRIRGKSRYASNLLRQAKSLLWRSFTSQFRDKLLFWTRMIQTLFIGVFIGLVYLQQEIDQRGVMNRNGAIFLTITNVSFTNVFVTLTTFPAEMHIVMRELGTQLYRIDVYYFTKLLAEIPINLVITLLFSVITYWMIGFGDSGKNFLIFCATYQIISFCSVSLGYLISVLCGETTLALSVAVPVMMPLLLFGGIFINHTDTPVYFGWVPYITFFRWANDALMYTVWKDIHRIGCWKDNVTVPFTYTMNYPFPNMNNPFPNMNNPYPNMNNPFSNMNNPFPNMRNPFTRMQYFKSLCRARMCSFRDGHDVLAYNDLQDVDVGICFLAMFVIMVFMYTASLIVLIIRSRRSLQ